MTCTLTLLGLDEPVTMSIPLFSPKKDVDTRKLKVMDNHDTSIFNVRCITMRSIKSYPQFNNTLIQDAVLNLRVTAVGIKQTELTPIAKQIAFGMDDIIAILRCGNVVNIRGLASMVILLSQGHH